MFSIETFIAFLLLGLGNGAIISGLGLGLVLTYRSSGVVNFAFGAMSMYVIYTFEALWHDGDLLNPIFGMPARIDLADGMPFAVAFAVSVVIAALLGLALYGAVFRPIRYARPLVKLVASVGVLIGLQAVVGLRFGTDALVVDAIFPRDAVSVFGVNVRRDVLFMAGFVVVLTAALSLLYGRTRFGKLSRAAAESEKGIVTIGVSSSRLAAMNWMIAAVVAGITGIIVSPLLTILPGTFSLLIVPALAVALAGSFDRFWWTVVAGLMLGMLQSEIAYLQGIWSWFPKTGVASALPFLIIVLLLVFRGSAVPQRGVLVEQSLPLAREPRNVRQWSMVLIPVAAALVIVLDGTWRLAAITSMVGAMLSLSLVIITGWVGQISFAQAVLAGFAGFTLSKLTTDIGVPFPIAPLIAALVAAVIGVVVGIPALRVRGVNLAVVTIGLALAITDFVFANPDYTGGFEGAAVEPPSLFGVDLSLGTGDAYPRAAFGFVVLFVATLSLWAAVSLRRSSFGREMLAIRANERAALASGINVANAKLVAFGISAFVAGLAGSFMGYQQSTISFASFGVFVSIMLVVSAYLAGITTVSGAIVAGVLAPSGLVFLFMDRVLNLGKYESLLLGVGLVGASIRHPEGIAGGVQGVLERRRRRRQEETPVDEPTAQHELAATVGA